MDGLSWHFALTSIFVVNCSCTLGSRARQLKEQVVSDDFRCQFWRSRRHSDPRTQQEQTYPSQAGTRWQWSAPASRRLEQLHHTWDPSR
jgi:hypothetical protein